MSKEIVLQNAHLLLSKTTIFHTATTKYQIMNISFRQTLTQTEMCAHFCIQIKTHT